LSVINEAIKLLRASQNGSVREKNFNSTYSKLSTNSELYQPLNY